MCLPLNFGFEFGHRVVRQGGIATTVDGIMRGVRITVFEVVIIKGLEDINDGGFVDIDGPITILQCANLDYHKVGTSERQCQQDNQKETNYQLTRPYGSHQQSRISGVTHNNIRVFL